MDNEKKLENLIKTYDEASGLGGLGCLGCPEGITVRNLLGLMLDAGISSTTIDSGNIGMLITDHCIEIVKYDCEAGDFKSIATIELKIHE